MQSLKPYFGVPALAAALCLFASVGAHAAPITYTVDLLALDGTTLTGTVVTDGTLGSLRRTNISSFSLNWTSGTAVESMNSSNADFLMSFGAGLFQASETSIFMLASNTPDSTIAQFVQSDGAFLFFDLTSGSDTEARRAEISGFNAFGSGGGQVSRFDWSGTQFTLGTAPAANVPEPTTLALAALALAGLGSTRRRR